MTQCERDDVHEPHTWWDERIVRDERASMQAGEPVGKEVITEEQCKGRKIERW